VKQLKYLLAFSLIIIPLLTIPINGNYSEISVDSEKQSKTSIIKQAAIDFSIQDVNSGTSYSLSDFWGKIVVLDMFATWCGPCQISLPYLREIYSEYSEEKVQIISIAVDPSESLATISQFRDDENMDWIVGKDLDGSIASDYRVSSIPVFYVIDQNGEVEWSDSGFTADETWPIIESTIKNLVRNAQETPIVARVFIIILEVVAGLGAAAGIIFAIYKIRKRLGVKNCLNCNAVANSKCSKCSTLICSNCSINGCPNCGSTKFVRL
jgi:thiol-disulfide isomerase/thioredoxin